MLANTFALLITDTLQGLKFPPKQYLEVEDAARAVTHALSLLRQTSQYTSTNLNLRSYLWNPQNRDESVQAATDIAMPAWLERQWGTGTRIYWSFVRTVNLAVVEEARLRGEFRCAFYNNAQDGQMHIVLSYDPADLAFPQHRLWYDPNPWTPDTLNDVALDATATGIPAAFAAYVTTLAELECISSMRIAAASQEKNKASEELISAWDAREKYLFAKASKWDDRFTHFVFGSRGARRGVRRRPILGRRRTVI